MTVVNPDSIAGITSVTSSGTTLEFYDVNGNLLDVSANLTGELTVGTGATISSPGASIIDFETNGNERFRIGSLGQLGIAGANYGTSGQVLTSAGSGSSVSWTTISQANISNNADNRVITGGSGVNLNGESGLTFNSDRLILANTSTPQIRINNDTSDGSSTRFVLGKATASNNFFNGAASGDSCISAPSNLLFGVGSSEKFRIFSDGKFGFGTASLSETTMAEFSSSTGGGAIGSNITIRNTSTNSVNNIAELRLKTAHGVARIFKYNTSETVFMSHSSGASDLIMQADGASNFRVNTNANERLRIDSSGRMGIGDNSPDRELVVKNGSSNSSIKIEASNAHTSQLFFSDTDAENVARIGVFHGSGQSTSNAMVFETGGTARLMISSSGDIIIRGSNLNNSSVSGQGLQINGTTRPTLILRGNASGGNTGEIQFADNSGTDSDPGTRVGLIRYVHAGTYANHMHFHTNEVERMVITHQGRVGISQSPAQLAGFAEQLQVTGLYGNNYAAAFKIEQSSGNLMRFATTVSGSYNLCGGITVNGSSTSFNTSSDYRLKENDVKISDGITRLKQLRPIRFNWKSDSSTTEDGFFAHEVSPVVPESVSGEKDAEIDAIGEGYQKIDHSKLIPLLTAALQESIAKIESLESKVESIEAQQANDAAYEAKIDKIIDYFKL